MFLVLLDTLLSRLLNVRSLAECRPVLPMVRRAAARLTYVIQIDFTDINHHTFETVFKMCHMFSSSVHYGRMSVCIKHLIPW